MSKDANDTNPNSLKPLIEELTQLLERRTPGTGSSSSLSTSHAPFQYRTILKGPQRTLKKKGIWHCTKAGKYRQTCKGPKGRIKHVVNNKAAKASQNRDRMDRLEGRRR